ncbi:MAG: energy-coupling factor ABC transporter permease [Pseudomonadota bacterium]
MHVDANLVESSVLIASWLFSAMALLLALSFAPWRALAAEPSRLHLVGAGALACLLLWMMNVQLQQGLLLHFLGVTTLTLVLGWSFAVLTALMSLVAFFILNDLSWSSLGLSLCLTAVLPATLTHFLVRSLRRPGLRHPFFYLLGAGFAGGAMTILCLALACAFVFVISDSAALAGGTAELWPLLFLVMFSEGFLNGMCVSALAIFYPDKMKTFDERFYLGDE